VKNLFVGALVCALQIFGPVFTIIDNWFKETNPLRDKDSFTKRELKCLGTEKNVLTTGMGTLFLLVIFEVVRAYARSELSNFDKCKYLPAGNHWMRLGQAANMTCIIATVIAMPLVFWDELSPKDIIFDSLAMLFVLTLDDVTHETFQYLEMEDDDFRRICTWSIALLGQCPLKLADVVNMDASSADEIWSIHMTKEGLVNARDKKTKCVTRLMEVPPTEETSLLPKSDSCTFRSSCFQYAWCEGESEYLRDGTEHLVERFMWLVTCYLLIVLEFIIPPIFFIINVPCYS
jgi:hypothetical protein